MELLNCGAVAPVPLPSARAAPPRRWVYLPPASADTSSSRRSSTQSWAVGISAAPPALRTITTCSAYSRTSWRTAILEEAGEPASPATTSGPDARTATPSTDGQDGPPASDQGDEHGGDGANGTLTAAELRVKLALAAGSGRLDLTDCRLPRVPPEVLELTELEELQLSGNCLIHLPEEISRLTALQRLGLAGNMLTSLPAGIGALTVLEGLWLHGNLLTGLPQQLGRLGALRALSLAGNCLESVPAGALSGLTSLTDLTLAGNRLTALPPRELAPLVRLRKLALNGNCLKGWAPGELGLGPHMTALGELMLQGNRLEAVDPAIFECPALTELSLADNRLTELPPRLAGAFSLSRLHLFGNRLTTLSARQLASLPALSTCWLEGNPLSGQTVSELVAVAGSGGMPQLKVLGLDRAQLATAAAAAATPTAAVAPSAAQAVGHPSISGRSLPPNVRIGCVLGSGPGYFKLQYGPQRPGSAEGAGGRGGDGGTDAGVWSSNELLVVSFGSAPGTPNWGGLLSKVYRAAATDEEKYYDVLYVADPARDWYGGGDDAVYEYYRDRLSSYTRHYRRVLMLGDSMGATAALLFADLATGVLAFCPQVDLTEASIRPGRPAAWLDCLRERLVAAVCASRGELAVLVGTWQHDLAQANLLPAVSGTGGRPNERRRGAGEEHDVRSCGSGSGSWRASGEGTSGTEGYSAQSPAGAAAQRKPWAWERSAASGQRVETRSVKGAASGSAQQEAEGADTSCSGGGVNVRVFSVDSHRLAAALDARAKLVPLVRDAVLHQLGLRSGNVRVANIL